MNKLGEIQSFINYLNEDIVSAIKELSGIPDASRRHLQKLVFIDVTNRFDSLIDSLLVSFAADSSDFRNSILSKLDEPIAQGEVFKLLLVADPRAATQERLRRELTLNYLSLSHRKKLFDLLSKCYSWADTDVSRPRVNPNIGSISSSKVAKHPKIPNSVLGYADWLYHRRNILVHGSGKSRSFTDSDIKYFRKWDNVTLAKTLSLKLSSIECTSRFYKDLCDLLIKS